MAHISSIGAGMFSDLSIAVPATAPDFATLDTAAEFHALFATAIEPNGTPAANTFIRVKNVREFPSMGTPPNIVNVPVYGQKTSQQIQGQADAPSMEIQLNLVGSDWDSSGTLGKLVGDGKRYVFRFALLNAEPPGYTSVAGATGLGGATAQTAVENSVWYWVGKVEAFLVNPQLTDANTATLTLSVQSDFYGAYTVANGT
jgi:hypothetical protein